MKTSQLLNVYLAKNLWNGYSQSLALFFVVVVGAVAVENVYVMQT
jgi:hypothetical protein